MRIISGSHKGRSIMPSGNLPVRPTTDFAKESLFNILFNYLDFEGLTALDLFAGTGNISYELASRGCSRVVAVEQHFKCCRFIKQTVEKLQLKAVQAVQANVFQYLQHEVQPFDLIFADPPYDLPNLASIPDVIFERDLLKDQAWLIIEHPRQIDFSQTRHFFQHREYGKVNFSFFVKNLASL